MSINEGVGCSKRTVMRWRHLADDEAAADAVGLAKAFDLYLNFVAHSLGLRDGNTKAESRKQKLGPLDYGQRTTDYGLRTTDYGTISKTKRKAESRKQKWDYGLQQEQKLKC